MRRNTGVLALGLCCAALCSLADGQIAKLEEYNGYVENFDYHVSWQSGLPRIVIDEPSEPGLPYDFFCWYPGTIYPATIHGIVPSPALEGDVELMVRSHDPIVPAGAAHVYEMRWLEQNAVYLTLKEFDIAGALGTPETPPHVYAIDGEFYAMETGGTFDVTHLLSGNMTFTYLSADINVTAQATHEGNLTIWEFRPNQAYNISIAGHMAGDLTLGDTPAYFPMNATVTV